MAASEVPWFALLLLVGSIALALAAYFFFSPTEVYTDEIPVTFLVGNTTGFDLNTSILSYGRIIPCSSSTRFVTITNDYAFPILATFDPSPTISSFLPPREELILPATAREIGLTVQVPCNATPTDYSGTMKISYHKAHE